MWSSVLLVVHQQHLPREGGSCFVGRALPVRAERCASASLWQPASVRGKVKPCLWDCGKLPGQMYLVSTTSTVHSPALFRDTWTLEVVTWDFWGQKFSGVKCISAIFLPILVPGLCFFCFFICVHLCMSVKSCLAIKVWCTTRWQCDKSRESSSQLDTPHFIKRWNSGHQSLEWHPQELLLGLSQSSWHKQ